VDTAYEFTNQLAKQTGHMLLERFDFRGTAADLKSDNSLVTAADMASDRMLTDAIHREYPDDEIISEETDTYLGNVDTGVWIIDPIDGTTNFSLGLHVWGISIAYVKNGAPQVAALYFPVLNELYSARRGGGAFLNGTPIHVKPPIKDQPAAFFTCCTRTHRFYNVSVPYKTRIYGAAAYDMCLVARGAALIGFQATTKIWDIAGGWLILEEAGGVAEPLSGPPPFPLQTNTEYKQVNYPTLMAATPELAEKGHHWIMARPKG
jgi:myo-inositol-1(or 4)-monophosphatase